MAGRPVATLFITADTNDVLSSVPQMRSAGLGVYDFIIEAAAAADGTFTVNDGKNNVFVNEPIPVKGAAVTYPAIDLSADAKYSVSVVAGNRPVIDVVDGTNGEITLHIWKRG